MAKGMARQQGMGRRIGSIRRARIRIVWMEITGVRDGYLGMGPGCIKVFDVVKSVDRTVFVAQTSSVMSV